ncbi:hypothetical protein AVEN_185890-1 [Araneus ventricosus]|uniref:ABC transmembrane type-1 domain-containing protein n=1 Tax=Araneus ventricosus TaxID=182803 RepID=A0A4Y2USN4_ARAVE|nr:hypothetical protein AVEN_185890-1 [Araneus ventricosus]
MASLIKKFTLIIFCSAVSFSFSQELNQSQKVSSRTGRDGYLYNRNNWSVHQTDYKKVSSNTVASSSDSGKGHDSSDSLKYASLSELDDFIPDRTLDAKYSYSPGGFYIPHEREAKFNYHFEEVTDSDQSENKGHVPDKVSSIDSNSKILTSSTETETGIIDRPTFLSVLKKAVLNPLVILSVAAVPLAFIIEMIFPYMSNMLSGNMLPTVATTIVSGFARNLDGDSALQLKQILYAIKKLVVNALEDPKFF